MHAGSIPTPAISHADAASSVVLAQGLAKSMDGRRVLDAIDLELPRGRCVALLGANGAGKSTLLRILAMLTPPTAGTLALFGAPAAGDRPELRARVGLIGHQTMLYRDMTPAENLEFFARLYRLSAPRDRAMKRLEFVGLAARADDPVRTLRRGMAQRVGIARALLHEPELLLADEPFTGLDAPSALRLAECLASLREQGRTIVLAHHDVHQALRWCEHVIVLRQGRMTLDAPSRGLDEPGALAAMEDRA